VCVSLEVFEERAKLVIEHFKGLEAKKALVVHHDDADGICSGAIVKRAFERRGLLLRAVCIEKLIPEAISAIHSERRGLVVYADLGSGHASEISRTATKGDVVVILDHHEVQVSEEPNVHHLNLSLFGFDGDRDFSASTCAYLFAKTLDRDNVDLACLAYVGSMEIPGETSGLNRLALEDALMTGDAVRRGNKVFLKKLDMEASKLFSTLQVLGPVGYYRGGPSLGLKLCTGEDVDEALKVAGELEELRKDANRRLLQRLRVEGLNKMRRVQWFSAGQEFLGMGTKVLGSFCSYASYQRSIVDPDKYLIGMMDMPSIIPELTTLRGTYTKVSVRAPDKLRAGIERGMAPSSALVLSRSCEGFGSADGHAAAASAVIERGREMELVDKFDRLASDWKP
jgi:single-stranded-DNA-specific exonuclease